ncbi:MFS transporter [Pseudonocardia nematodicida]|uniref:MFS transporter n=1 Tax=Pseudonocardia nematodicida TaxID=1206997 RepID=A0ABV1KE40_9PSEU
MELHTMRVVTRRLIPFLGLLYMVAYIDRSNVGFAKLTLQSDLGLSEAAFFMGAGMFFIAYAIFEVPSNLILERVGARRWFARIAISWGLITVLTSLTWNESSFYVLRFLLGAAEAGFYPGVIYYLTKWFPGQYRARIFGLFIFANPVSFALGNPLLGWLSSLHGNLGLSGWQWIFIVTGVPAVLLGIATLLYLPDTPDKAKWLTAEQKQWINKRLDEEEGPRHDHSNPLSPLKSPRVWFFVAHFLMLVVAAYGLSFWLPTIVSGFGVGDVAIGFLTSIPYVCAALALWLLPRSADRRGEHFWHMGIPLAVAGVAMAASLLVESPVLRLALMSVAAAGILGPQPIFWALSSTLFTGIRAAATIAAINSVGNLGGWLGPLAIGAIVDSTGRVSSGLWIIAGAALLGGVAVVGTRRLVHQRDTTPPVTAPGTPT